MLAALFLSACGGNVDVTPTEGISISDVYTAAVMTLTAQAGSVTPTATVLPTTTPTIWASPTFMPSTSTAQSIGYSYSTANGCYNSVYVSDVTIPDGTVLAPGKSFTKTWKIQNTGNCAWDKDFELAFETGADMDGENTAIDEAVTARETDSISVTPPGSGNRRLLHRLLALGNRRWRCLWAVRLCIDCGIRGCSHNHSDTDSHINFYAHIHTGSTECNGYPHIHACTFRYSNGYTCACYRSHARFDKPGNFHTRIRNVVVNRGACKIL
jgi:Ig-like domain from next to BRCA1 gene